MKSLLLRSRSERGSALVEIGVALPVVVAIFIGTADFARVFYYAMELNTAARAGAQCGAFNSTSATLTPENMAAIVSAARSAAPNIAPIDPPVVTSVCQCALNDGTAPASWTFVACSPTPTCPSGRHVVQTVTVQTGKTFTTISGFLQMLRSTPLTRTATMRVAL